MKLNNFFSTLLVIGLLFNCSLYLLNAFEVLPTVSIPIQTDFTTWEGWFSLDNLAYKVLGIGALAISVVALLFKANTYAIYALLIVGLGCVIQPIQEFIFVIPNTLGLLLPEAANPTPGLVNPIIAVFGVIFGFFAFWFILSIVIQRDV